MTSVATETWTNERLERTVREVRELRQQLDHVQDALAHQSAQLLGVETLLQTVDGRTLRHEAVQDATRDSGRALSALTEQHEQEAAMRRDQHAASERERATAGEARQQLAAAVAAVESRMAALERPSVPGTTAPRDAAPPGGRREALRDEAREARLAGLEQAVAADRKLLRTLSEQLSREHAAVEALNPAVAAIARRTEATQRDQRRAGAAIAAAGSEHEGAPELRDVLEQQRAVRRRLEERLAAVDVQLEALRRDAQGWAEERAVQRRQLAGAHERLVELSQQLEAQRLAVLDHLRLLADAGTVSGKRQAEELDRANRVARDLVLRLAERGDSASQEQPL